MRRGLRLSDLDQRGKCKIIYNAGYYMQDLLFNCASNAIDQRLCFMVALTHIAPYDKATRYLQVRIIDCNLK